MSEWMRAVELPDGSYAEAYRQVVTRNYLILDHEGRGFDDIRCGRFEEVEVRLLWRRP